MEYAVNSYKNPNKEVRDAAYQLIMNCYKYIGDNVKNYFKDLRQPQINTLEDGFDQLDSLNNYVDNTKKNVNSKNKKQPKNEEEDNNNRSQSRSRSKENSQGGKKNTFYKRELR